MRNEDEQMTELNLLKYVTVRSKILATASQRTAPHRETNSAMGLGRTWEFFVLGRP